MITASYISKNYWDMLLPVRTDKIAQNLGYKVLPINDQSYPNAHLMVSVEDKVPTIGYNIHDNKRDIRKVIALGIAKHINQRLGNNETLIYEKDVFTKNDSFLHLQDLEMAWQLLTPYESVRTMVLDCKVYQIEELAKIFDVQVLQMNQRLKEVGLLP